MKAQRRLRGASKALRVFEFAHSHPENFLKVESYGAGVRIRAARDNFTARDKAFFVRHLANEGFIAYRYRSYSDESGGATGIEWVLEGASIQTGMEKGRPQRGADAFMTRLLVYSFLLWLITITLLVLKSG